MLAILFVAAALAPMMVVAWVMVWLMADALRREPQPVLYPLPASPQRQRGERWVA